MEKYEYLIEIAYKSGYSFQMWFTKFEIENGNWTWANRTKNGRIIASPLILGVEDIVSVIQLDSRKIRGK